MQWRIVGKDGIIVEVMEVVGVEGSRVLFERFQPPHDTVLKRYRVAIGQSSARRAVVIYLPPTARSVHFPLALLTTQEWGFAAAWAAY
eukprot:COSAG02_NODE_4441_length_5354_cov_3.167650_1_plen_88_part_00